MNEVNTVNSKEIVQAVYLPPEATQLSLDDLAEAINAEHAACLAAGQSFIDHALACGHLLIEAKKRVPHGKWLDWIGENFHASEDTAQIYMKVARASNTETSRYSSLVQALAALAKGIPEERERRSLNPIDLPTGSWPVLYVDPPWRYEYSETESRAIENQYPTMELEKIKTLDPPAAEDSVLFLWATSPKLDQALEVMEAWSFQYRTSMVWVKDQIGMGYYARQQHEFLLIGKRGEPPVPEAANRPKSVVLAPRGKHSEKPEEFYAVIEAMYPDCRGAWCEMFARKQRDGWVSWGDEV